MGYQVLALNAPEIAVSSTRAGDAHCVLSEDIVVVGITDSSGEYREYGLSPDRARALAVMLSSEVDELEHLDEAGEPR